MTDVTDNNRQNQKPQDKQYITIDKEWILRQFENRTTNF